MAPVQDSPLDQFLTAARVLLDGIESDPEVFGVMVTYGYGPSKWSVGRDLFDEVQRDHDELSTPQTQALARWIADLKAVAKVAFANRPHLLDRLGVQ